MRSDIFIEWLNHLDYYFRTMGRKILLLIDNAGSHFNPKRLEKDDEQNDENDTSENDSNSEQESSQNHKKRKNKKRQSKKKVTKKIAQDISLTNIELVYLPPNTTAHL